MTTRSSTIRQLEKNLRETLLELQKCKKFNEDLLLEREENELELQNILDKNKLLKSEMAGLHQQVMDALEERDQYRRVVAEFDQSYSTYENTLRRIDELESELRDAYHQIVSLQNTKSDLESAQTQSLFDELVGGASACSPGTSQPPSSGTLDVYTIDLTGNDSLPPPSSVELSPQHTMYTCIRKQCNDLLTELNACRIALDTSQDRYDCDTRHLRAVVISLNDQLTSITRDYKSAQCELAEHAKAMDALLEMCKENENRFNSLTANHVCECERTPDNHVSPARAPRCSPPAPPPRVMMQTDSTSSLCASISQPSIENENESNIVMFSDEIGMNMGLRVGRCTGQAILNYCLPGASFQKIMEKILARVYKRDTTLLIFVGRRGNTNKKQLIQFISQLNDVENICKVIILAFPFGQDLNQKENMSRHCLNINLYNLSTSCKKIHLIDTNKFIGRQCYFTKDNYYLCNYLRRKIAELLSYSINKSYSVNTLTTLTSVPIEQTAACADRTLDFVPNNVNYLN